jgi:flagellar hook-associated protein 3 FlgL
MRTSLSQQIQTALMFMDVSSRKLSDAQQRAVSGKRINKSSDDVSGTNASLGLRTSISSVDQYSNNIQVGKPFLDVTMNSINQLAGVMRTVRTIAVAASNEDFTGTTKDTYVQQLNGILANMEDIANTKHTDMYIFSGGKTDQPAVLDTSGTYSFNGDTTQRKTKVLSWVTVPINVSGGSLFNFDGHLGAGSTDTFSVVKQLRDMIQSGDSAGVSNQIKQIDQQYDNLLSIEAEVGAASSRMDAAQSSLADTKIRLQQMLSDIEDVDLPMAIVDLKTQENVYQTALNITNRMLELSLASTSSR